MTRYFYATRYKSYDEAQDALIDMFASGEVDLADWPLVESYTAKNGQRRYGITIRG